MPPKPAISKEARPKPVNPEGYLATQDLKERGWTPRLIADFLGPHDHTRENGLRMGRRKLPPVKLYLEARVDEAERQDRFLAAQAKAADARERATRRQELRAAQRTAQLEAAAQGYAPTIHPEPLRKGAKNKAREPYLPKLKAFEKAAARELGGLSDKEAAQLRKLLLARLDEALSAVYEWFGTPSQPKKSPVNAGASGGEAKPSDWREWDWE